MVNTAVFYYDFKGKQEQVYKFDGVTNTVTQNYLNVGNAQIYGIEAELIFQPSRRWDFNFYGGWMHGKITKSETILQESFGANILLEDLPLSKPPNWSFFSYEMTRASCRDRVDCNL